MTSQSLHEPLQGCEGKQRPRQSPVFSVSIQVTAAARSASQQPLQSPGSGDPTLLVKCSLL